ncbi:type II toxin-antitoxin system VapC family toxin [Rhizobium sp. KVB221]|uniref:Type II toxin-antitoxin system VapC family toxin n=1 Tax=Rhizobium setariae TaxID=2801340 RepID=A0A936YRA9_9HYPH|nr:type II toxin-antitoxin system VapC family toxin [Rhizobium setariae]MBL0375310.1 type II toxin-antitoxin system VapC family toxin [Rhizobium setariae]
MTTERYLLDTCALIYLAHDEPISVDAGSALRELPAYTEGVFVSAFSAWEIAKLVSKGRMNITKLPLVWFEDVVGKMRAIVVEASPAILVASSFLPEPLHGDPADRILIATAREHDLTVITRDRAMLAYGAAGHVKALAC